MESFLQREGAGAFGDSPRPRRPGRGLGLLGSGGDLSCVTHIPPLPLLHRSLEHATPSVTVHWGHRLPGGRGWGANEKTCESSGMCEVLDRNGHFGYLGPCLSCLRPAHHGALASCSGSPRSALRWSSLGTVRMMLGAALRPLTVRLKHNYLNSNHP